jgi:hypothetical protein
MDPANGVPKRDETGKYLVRKTACINTTIIDILRTIKSQGTLMIHVVDGIDTINPCPGRPGFFFGLIPGPGGAGGPLPRPASRMAA